MRLSLALFLSLTLTLFALPATAQTSTHRPQAPRAAEHEPGISLILNECEADQCKDNRRGLMVFDGNQGQALWGWGATGSMTITSYANGVIVIDRVGEPDFREHYEGTVSGNSITGRITIGGKTDHWEATIEPALCRTAEACPLSPRQLSQLGENSFNAGLHVAGFELFVAAAKLGDSDGQAFTAYVLYGDEPTASERAAAFQLAHASADQNNFLGMLLLSKMYETGSGTKADAQLATYWKDKANATKAAEQQAAARQRAQPQPANVGQLFMGALMKGMLSGDLDGDPEPFSDSQTRVMQMLRANHPPQH